MNATGCAPDGPKRARAVALYLPQYHPIPENDAWWGPGFTEWTNVARARPLFRGHVQPKLPADLGFYDLRLRDVRIRQAELAQEHGIEAFCYWHYWFGRGRQLLERPFQEVVSSGEPGISFCVGWANESWTGIWHGAHDRVLIEQEYPGSEDVEAHFAALLPAFRDERYFRVGGRPLFYVYKPAGLPSAPGFVDQWQSLARKHGLGSFFMVAGLGSKYTTHVGDGFDSGFYNRLPQGPRVKPTPMRRVLRRQKELPAIFEYSAVPLQHAMAGVDPSRVQPCIVPNWDNTPRSGRSGRVLVGSTPERFRVHVNDALRFLAGRPFDEQIVWVKSWNEWAEGNYLEPDAESGHARLQVLRDELLSTG